MRNVGISTDTSSKILLKRHQKHLPSRLSNWYEDEIVYIQGLVTRLI